MRRLIVDLKAEYPGFNPNEIANACYVRFGRRPARKTVKRVLAEEDAPLRFVRRFPAYHETEEPAERRRTVVALHAEGWSAKAIAGYLRVHRSTVHRVLRFLGGSHAPSSGESSRERGTTVRWRTRHGARAGEVEATTRYEDGSQASAGHGPLMVRRPTPEANALAGSGTRNTRYTSSATSAEVPRRR